MPLSRPRSPPHRPRSRPHPRTLPRRRFRPGYSGPRPPRTTTARPSAPLAADGPPRAGSPP
eukprot:170670-Prorocentrum_minimum.AAC.1